ncbi:choline-phosphate cytidylyltransferase [Coprinopsis cinerea okayama7|uniref:choline-phosphate cytidylyltransferase n=1 Tax=Coprinopsis cinerea (strain Okayama-7 / 130 / ATCC MYA-4618 / FGSC 9003) TaxID=240176 RepID=A8N963_COPC7|nr:choline-phosphate cytidylyltransferase [Coprinopsis cinerea okayama7\|eukprot:XP_001831391.2 choline-phosphate cytidylyltransferase [Coprinopsis cinerea okayama7\
MDNSIVFDDDEYDLVSNHSLESSVADLSGTRVQGKDIKEPEPTPTARERFETINWTPEEIQTYVRKALSLSSAQEVGVNHKTVRVYVDGPFDMFNVGHVLQLRQAKLAFPLVHLTVGVFSDQVLNERGYPPVWSEVERVEMVRHCRWVDEVITNVPWELTDEFLLQRRLDYLALDEGTSVDPNCDKARVRAYDIIKKLGKVIPTRRTRGFPIVRLPLTSPSTPVMPTQSMPQLQLTTADDGERLPEPEPSNVAVSSEL